MTAADRPSVSRVGDTITSAGQLDALPPDAIVRTPKGNAVTDDVVNGRRWWFFTGNSRAFAANEITMPATVLYVPGEPSRPSVTDNARAECHANLVALGAQAARAQHEEDPGTLRANLRGIAGALRYMAEQERAAGRAETTTATDEDAITEAARVIAEQADEPMWSAVVIAKEMASRGLLATARTRPTREQIAFAIARGVDGMTSADYEDASDDYRNEMLEGADAVLALFSEEVDR